ncbi:TetR/AcrR family transcriptional regulator [Nocardia sp. NPDC058519]|uniref:TetR/AcrR family transcriptional regulator n=1 Tax=Nocardia sp. NPDC058519 TaxID=3346535 RepID=UPI00365615F4
MASPTEGRRRSDAARSGRTRERILQAAVDSLIEDGYAATSIGAIQSRSGVSRGALLHQYPNKAHLLVDAVRHLSDQQVDEVLAYSEPAAAEDWMTVLWHSFATPLFGAVLELWVAARTDADLRGALLRHQRDLHGSIRESITRNLEGPLPENFDSVFEMTLTYFRGLALTTILSTNHRDRLLDDWRATMRSVFSSP